LQNSRFHRKEQKIKQNLQKSRIRPKSQHKNSNLPRPSPERKVKKTAKKSFKVHGKCESPSKARFKKKQQRIYKKFHSFSIISKPFINSLPAYHFKKGENI
jgi:hypothetical protein